MIILFSKFSNSQSTPGIIQDWADYIGYQDTLVRIPVLQDGLGNIVTAGFTVDSLTGADLLVAKYKQAGELIWQRTFSGAGYNRDQATALALDDSNNVYVAGAVFSVSTNYDFVLLKYDSAGLLQWSALYNGSANNYDGPCAVSLRDSFVYVTGAVNNAGTFLDLVTIQYNAFTGAQNWVRTYDYAGLSDVPVAIETNEDGDVMVTGASQQTVNDWSYVVLTFSYAGTPSDTLREDGTANGFDRANAVKNDGAGNFYITGASAVNGEGFNIKTIKINTADTIEWIAQYNTNGIDLDDEGNGIATDDSGNVYVAGVAYRDNEDYVLIKYDASGTEEWVKYFNNTGIDAAKAICLDSYGNIVITGVSANATNDILTVAYDTQGNELWHDYFDGANHDDDYATDIIADSNGHIYVTGQSGDGAGGFEQVTIKYSTDYFLVPQDTVPPPSSLLFYPNAGQIIDTQDSVRYDVSFYTINQFPKLYIHQDSISFVMAHVDSDTATTDTLERITMNFANGNMAYCDPYTTNTHDTDQVLNYFLGHCPDGITGITGSEKIMYSNVYENTDIIFSNNNAGMKFQIIMNPGAEPQAVLHFTGHESLQLVNNADLQVSGMLGSFIYERPLVYQLDEEGNRISLGWLASYLIVDSANVAFQLAGNYDSHRPLVVECAREVQNLVSNGNQPQWCSYFGDVAGENGTAVTNDVDGNVYFTGFTNSPNFPHTTGLLANGGTGIDAYISKFGRTGEPNNYPATEIDQLKWSTYYGGTNKAVKGLDIATSGDGTTGKVFVVGVANGETNFPLYAPNSEYEQTYFPPNHSTGVIIGLDNSTGGDLLNGGYRFASYFGGSGSSSIGKEQINSIALDGGGNIYIAGETNSAACSSAYYCQVPGDNGFPICNASGSGLIQQGNGDGFIAKFDNNLQLIWCTLYGGSEEDEITSIALDGNNHLYITGHTKSGSGASTTFPVTASGNFDQSYGGGIGDAFIAKYTGTTRQWATFFGGDGDEEGLAIAIDQNNKIYIGGFTSSNSPAQIYTSNPCDFTVNDCNVPPSGDFPIADGNQNGQSANPYYYIQNILTSGGPDPNCNLACDNALFGGGNSDGFIARFNQDANLEWSTYVGGNGDDKITGLTVADYEDYSQDIHHRICFSGITFSTNINEYWNSVPVSYLHSYGWATNNSTAFHHSGFLGYAEINNNLCVPWISYFINLYTGNSVSHPLQDDITSISAYDQHMYFTGSVLKDFSGGSANSPIPLAKMTNVATAYGVFNYNGGSSDAIIGRFAFDRPWWDVIPESEKNSSATIFPNPSSGKFILRFEGDSYKDICVNIFNPLGLLVFSFEQKADHPQNHISFDLSDKADGVYFVQATTDNHTISQKIILHRE